MRLTCPPCVPGVSDTCPCFTESRSWWRINKIFITFFFFLWFFSDKKTYPRILILISSVHICRNQELLLPILLSMCHWKTTIASWAAPRFPFQITWHQLFQPRLKQGLLATLGRGSQGHLLAIPRDGSRSLWRLTVVLSNGTKGPVVRIQLRKGCWKVSSLCNLLGIWVLILLFLCLLLLGGNRLTDLCDCILGVFHFFSFFSDYF